MRKGFTLLELMVVLIIIGILATLGTNQYTKIVERARGSEAKQMLRSIKGKAAGIWLEKSGGSTVPTETFIAAEVGIGTDISGECDDSELSKNFFFKYNITQTDGNDGFKATAQRCISKGKSPSGSNAAYLNLTTNFTANTDTWDIDPFYQ